MTSEKITCVCGTIGSAKYLRSSQHTKTLKHQGIRTPAPTTSEIKATRHTEYIKYKEKKFKDMTEEERKELWRVKKQAQRKAKKEAEKKVSDEVAPKIDKDDKKNLDFIRDLYQVLDNIKNTPPEKQPALVAKVIEKIQKQAVQLKANTDCENLTQELQRLQPELDPKTLKGNEGNLKRLYKNMFNKPFNCNDFTWLKDTEAVSQAILKNPKWKSIATHKTYFSSIASYLRHMTDLQKEYKFYSKAGTDLNDDYVEKKKENLLSERQKGDLVKWSDIKKLKEKAKKSNLHNYLYYLLYTEIPVRRAQDYARMVLWRDNKNNRFSKDKMDKNTNYLVLYEDPKDKKGYLDMYLNKYKGKARKSLGAYHTKITGELFDKFKDFVNLNGGVPTGRYIFDPDKENPTEKQISKIDSTISKEVKQAFAEIRGKKDSIIGINDLRKAFASSFVNDKTLSEKKKEEIATAMGTSLSTLRSDYLMLDLAE
jgi:hypothetical protein